LVIGLFLSLSRYPDMGTKGFGADVAGVAEEDFSVGSNRRQASLDALPDQGSKWANSQLSAKKLVG